MEGDNSHQKEEEEEKKMAEKEREKMAEEDKETGAILDSLTQRCWNFGILSRHGSGTSTSICTRVFFCFFCFFCFFTESLSLLFVAFCPH
jgi:hypothetical protein